MSDLKIEDATPDTDVQGGELVPVSDGGAPKCVSVEQLKDFVMEAVKGLVESVTTSKNDLVLLKKDGALKLATLGAVSSSVGEALLASDGEDEVSKGAKYKFIATRNGAKIVLQLDALTNYFSNALSGQIKTNMLSGATAYTGTDPDYQSFLVKGSGGFLLVSGTTLLGALFKAGRAAGLGISSTNLNAEKDSLLIVSDYTKTIKATPFKDLGLGDGDVKGPGATVTDGEIARFDGTTGKKVKGGISLATSVNAQTSLASDAKVPTEKAVAAAVATGVRLSGTQGAAGTVPYWGPTEKTLTSGLDALTQYDASADTSALACVGFVTGYLSALTSSGGQIYESWAQCVPRPTSATVGSIPMFTSATGDIGNGYAVTDTVSGGTADQRRIPTANAVYNAAKGAVTIVSSVPADGATGYVQGEMRYCTAASGKGLYINTGSVTKSAWVKLCAPAE